MKITDFELYLENPSKVLEKDISLVRYVKKGEVMDLVDESGEFIKVQKLSNDKTVLLDNREYRKLYIEELGLIKELSSSGLRVMCYVLKVLGVKKDSVVINIEDCMEFTGYKSRVAVYGGIVDLLGRGILFRGNGVYFINVNAFYNGRRK